MRTRTLLGACVASLPLVFAPAHAQGLSNSLPNSSGSDMVFQNGVDLETFMEIARASGIPNVEIRDSPAGRAVALSVPGSGTFYVTAFGCQQNICPALHFFAMVNSDGLDPDRIDFNDFNFARPQGNGAYVPSARIYVAQRMITSLQGIPRSAVEFELAVFQEYATAYVTWLRDRRADITAVAADATAEPAEKIDNVISAETAAFAASELEDIVGALMAEGRPEEEVFFQK